MAQPDRETLEAVQLTGPTMGSSSLMTDPNFRTGAFQGARSIGAVDLAVRPYQAGENTFEKFVELPADTSPVNLGPFVFGAVREFLALFDGYTITLNRAEQETRRALQPT